MSDEILYEVRDGIAWLTINRPEARNALNKAARDGFWEASRAFAADDTAQVLVVTGAGDKAFCAGADLKEMAQTKMGVPPKDLFPEFGRTVKTDKPTIAAVNGHAFAGGFRIAQMVDLVISSDHATYAISEPKVGRGAPWAAPLAWIVGPRIALELLCTAQPLSAARMYDLGFVNRVVPRDQLLDEAENMARAVAANAPLSVRAGKKMVYRSADLGFEAGLDGRGRVVGARVPEQGRAGRPCARSARNASPSGRGNDMSPTDVDPRHDLVHTPDPGRERWRESYYFQFVDFHHGIGSYHGPGYRPRQGLHRGAARPLGSRPRDAGRDREGQVLRAHGGSPRRRLRVGDRRAVEEVADPLRRAAQRRWPRARRADRGGGGRRRRRRASKINVSATTSSFERDRPAYIYDENPEWDGLFDGHIDEVGTVTRHAHRRRQHLRHRRPRQQGPLLGRARLEPSRRAGAGSTCSSRTGPRSPSGARRSTARAGSTTARSMSTARPPRRSRRSRSPSTFVDRDRADRPASWTVRHPLREPPHPRARRDDLRRPVAVPVPDG